MSFNKLIIPFLLISTFFISMFIFSCETPTKLHSWIDSTYNGGYINNILVMAIVKDLEYRTAYENEVVNQLSERDIHSVQSLKILSPTKTYSEEDFDTILTQNKLESIIFIKYLGTEVEKVDNKGKTFYKYYKKTLKSTFRSGYYEIHRTVIVEISLFTANNGKIIWSATAKTTNAIDVNDLANSLAKEIIKNLEEKKLIKPKIK